MNSIYLLLILFNLALNLLNLLVLLTSSVMAARAEIPKHNPDIIIAARIKSMAKYVVFSLLNILSIVPQIKVDIRPDL